MRPVFSLPSVLCNLAQPSAYAACLVCVGLVFAVAFGSYDEMFLLSTCWPSLRGEPLSAFSSLLLDRTESWGGVVGKERAGSEAIASRGHGNAISGFICGPIRLLRVMGVCVSP